MIEPENQPEELFFIRMENPPEKWVKKNHKIKLKQSGAVKEFDTFYLTANLFYSPPHWGTLYKIIDFAKAFLFPHMKDIPKIEKAQLEIIYFHPSDTFDLDNKGYFWEKLILDIMKTPTSGQIIKANEYGRTILTVEAIKDDTVRYVNRIVREYRKGAPAIELRITGRLAQTQQSLF